MVEDVSNAEESQTLLCAGLPLAGTHEISLEERARALRWTRRIGLRSWLALLATPTVVLLVLGAMVSTGKEGWIAAMPIAFLVMLQWAWPYARKQATQVRHFRRLGRALRIPARIARFEGIAESAQSWDRLQNALRSEGALRTSSGEAQTLDVLESAGIVLRVNGVFPRRFHQAVIARVARTPENAAIAAQWVKPLFDDPTTHVHQRALSEAEIEELRQFIRSATPWRAVFIVAVWMILVVVVLANRGWASSALILMSGVVVLRSAVVLIKSAKVLRKLMRDVSIGRVVIVRETRSESTPDSPEDGEALGPPSEFLPVSRLWWTRDGSVAPWRKGGLLSWASRATAR